MQYLLLSLPAAFFASAYFLARRRGRDWRENLLCAALCTGAAVAITTESLSLFRSVHRTGLVVAWATLLIVAVLLLRRRQVSSVSQIRPRPHGDAHAPASAFVILLPIVPIVVITFIIAITAAPDTWDSMTYHMSRVMYWIQNRHVGFFPTHNPRQVYLNPFAEYAILHLQILAGGDRLANLVQWFSMIGSLIAVSLIAREIGLDGTGQAVSSLVAATIPMGLMQSTSTQNDYVLAFYLSIFVYFILRWYGQPRLRYVWAMAFALGLAVLTKGTAYFFGAPFVAWVGLLFVYRLRAEGIRCALFVAVLVLTLNAPHYVRNFRTFGSALVAGSDMPPGMTFTNDAYSLPIFVSGILRNIGVHLRTANKGWNAGAQDVVVALHKELGVDPNDPRTTWRGSTFRVQQQVYDENVVSNFAHTLLAFASLIFLLCTKAGRNVRAILLAGCVLGGFLLFCLLRWQPWHSRLHLALFLLGSPLVGLMLVRAFRGRLMYIVLPLLCWGAIPNLLDNQARPFRGERTVFNTRRMDHYFDRRTELATPYEQASRYIKNMGLSRIGLFMQMDDGDYPVWVLLNPTGSDARRITHFAVDNATGRLANDREGETRQPDCIWATCEIPVTDSDIFGGEYVLTRDYGYVTLWTKEDSTPNRTRRDTE